MTSRLGVCSWSLLPESPADLVCKVTEVGVSAVQLALEPLRTREWPIDGTADALGAAGIEIRSGMMTMRGEDYSTLDTIKRTGGVRPDEHWEANLAAADANAAVAVQLGLKLVTFHAGFIPHDRTDPLREVMIERLREVVDRFAGRGVRVALETGQESAETLNDALEQLDRPEVGVNLDPANMILYGMGDPVEAARRLAPRVLQIHIKDALPAATPGTWGREVPVGTGAVDWSAFFDEFDKTRLSCDLVIEREAGETRIADIRQARELVERLVPREGTESR
jgi:L-ribulose-5-phosphate 3-epimerase